MSASLNRAMLIGNLGRDPEIRTLQDGSPVANLSIATSESWKDKNTGERKEKTEWHRVVVFDKNAVAFAEKYLKKGSKVYIEGKIQTRKWTDQSGTEKYSTEVVISPFKGVLQALDAVSDTHEPEEEKAAQNAATGGGDLNDSIPF